MLPYASADDPSRDPSHPAFSRPARPSDRRLEPTADAAEDASLDRRGRTTLEVLEPEWLKVIDAATD